MSSLEVIWFGIVAAMLATYVVLDGFDLGAGIVHFRVARSDEERQDVLRAIGPVWDGNEVWLVAAGAALFLAFPVLFATAFSGFYLPLMLVLWLLVLRALGIELRHQLHHPMWSQLWDAVFSVSSGLLVFAFGAALGNVVRGVDLDVDGHFFAPLWTDFGVDGPVGVLDWYTTLVGAAAVSMMSVHGALWLALRCEGAVASRSLTLVRRLLPAVGVAGVLLTVASAHVQPSLVSNLSRYPAGLAIPLVAAGGFLAIWVFVRRGDPGRAFAASCAWVAGALGSAAFAIFPMVLPSRNGAGLSLHEAAADEAGLRTALFWFVPGIAIAIAYFVVLYRSLPWLLEQPASTEPPTEVASEPSEP